MLSRAILKQLETWSIKRDRKPLILRGARQVGKTTVVEMFAKNFDTYLYLNLEKREDKYLFEQQLDIHALVSAIYLHKQKSKNGRCLIFIDEIQASPHAVKLLRFFYEETPDLFVICAGSLLESLIETQISFPVGRVEYLFMRPFTFQEFLEAIEYEEALIAYHKIPFPVYAHQTLLKLFHKYCLLGGMPEIVKKYVEQKEEIVNLNSVYKNLLTAYLDDVEKYARNNTMRQVIRHVIQQAPFYAGHRIKFEGFGRSNYKSREVGEAMRVLEKAMILNLIYPSTSQSLPIQPDFKKCPRLQFFDTGIINYLLGIQKEYFSLVDLNTLYQGFVAEHIVGQSLSACEEPVSFWVREKKQSQAEVDFIISYKKNIVPIEVKSGKTGRLRSLHTFIDITRMPNAVRLYAGKLSVEQTKTIQGQPYTLINLPYFLVSKINDYLDYYLN